MNRAIVPMVSQARTWGRSGAPPGPVCSIWLLLDIVLDRNLHLSSNLFIARRKVLTDRSWKHVCADSFGQRAARLNS